MASRTANVNVRVEPEIKEQAEKILEQLGISTSAFINMTYRQVILHKGVPFELTCSEEPKTLDRMSDEEFDLMMQTGLDQARKGDSVPYEEAFASLMRGL